MRNHRNCPEKRSGGEELKEEAKRSVVEGGLSGVKFIFGSGSVELRRRGVVGGFRRREA